MGNSLFKGKTGFEFVPNMLTYYVNNRLSIKEHSPPFSFRCASQLLVWGRLCKPYVTGLVVNLSHGYELDVAIGQINHESCDEWFTQSAPYWDASRTLKGGLCSFIDKRLLTYFYLHLHFCFLTPCVAAIPHRILQVREWNRSTKLGVCFLKLLKLSPS